MVVRGIFGSLVINIALPFSCRCDINIEIRLHDMILGSCERANMKSNDMILGSCERANMKSDHKLFLM